MNCTRIKDNKKCDKETGKPVPEIWRNHTRFDPQVVRVFFLGTDGITQEMISQLDAFVCPDCMPEWKDYIRRSNASYRAKRRMAKALAGEICQFQDGDGI